MRDQVILTLFFSDHISFKNWKESGIWGRELALYQRMEQEGVVTQYITYGDANDREFAPESIRERVYSNSWGLSEKSYSYFLPFLQMIPLSRSQVYKTNQMDGADPARRAAKLWRKPWIARGGYMWSEFVAQKRGVDSDQYRKAEQIELQAWKEANQIFVTTPQMQSAIQKRLSLAVDKIHVQANYVDTDLFKPLEIKKKYDCVFVGRMTRQKNLRALLQSVQNLGFSILIVGEGEEKEALQKEFSEYPSIHWFGNVSHENLPSLIQQARIFVFPSLYEGHPKALVEAMACGMAVMASDVEGNRELVLDRESGRLCATDQRGIQEVLQSMISEKEGLLKWGSKAREKIVQNFSLDRLAQKEASIIRSLAGK